MKYRITANLSSTDEKITVELDAENEDAAWKQFYKDQFPRGVYNGIVEELPTRAELITAVKKFVSQLPDDEIELARAAWGNTNTNIVKKYKDELIALLKE